MGVRPLISESEVDKVLRILQEKAVSKASRQTWNRRYREYVDKIKTGSVYKIAGIIRDLYALKVKKQLSHGENKMFDRARGLVVSELKLVTDLENLKSNEDVKDIFFDRTEN